MDEIIELSNSYPERSSLLVKFPEIQIYDPDIAARLLIDPDITLELGRQALRELATPTGVTLYEANLRIIDLPSEKITDIRSRDIGKFISIEGRVTKVKEIKPRIAVAVFQCPFCYHQFVVSQEHTQFKEPLECPTEDGGCGRSPKKFILKDDCSKFVDTQRIILEDLSEDEKWQQELEANLEDDLVGKVSWLDSVIVTGVLRTYQEKRKNVKFDFCLYCNSIEHKEAEVEEEVSAKDEGRRREPVRSIRVIIKGLENGYGEEVPLEEVYDLAEREGIGRERVDEIIDTMKRDGILFSLGRGVVMFVR